MKHITIKALIIFLIFSIQSCSTKDCIELEDNVPTQTICENGLLIMRSEDIGQPLFSLDSISKPVTKPLNFQNIRQDAQDDMQFDVITRPSNYDAYDAVNQMYYIEFPLEQRLYKYNIQTQTRQEFTVAGFYSAPVFNNGNLYAITIDNNGYATNPANYTIESINTNDGSLTALATNSFPLQSYFNWESMSSASNGNGMLYFVSGSHLISYDTVSTSTQYTDLVPGFDFTTNFQIFFGLELRDNGNLLAIRERDNDQGEGIELVEINISNFSQNPTVVFDFTANGIEPNSEFYSTTYDACDDNYYVTSLNSDFTTTDFYQIDLSTGTVLSENHSFYLMGIESKTN